MSITSVIRLENFEIKFNRKKRFSIKKEFFEINVNKLFFNQISKQNKICPQVIWINYLFGYLIT
jgi:hypothetical protein